MLLTLTWLTCCFQAGEEFREPWCWTRWFPGWPWLQFFPWCGEPGRTRAAEGSGHRLFQWTSAGWRASRCSQGAGTPKQNANRCEFVGSRWEAFPPFFEGDLNVGWGCYNISGRARGELLWLPDSLTLTVFPSMSVLEESVTSRNSKKTTSKTKTTKNICQSVCRAAGKNILRLTFTSPTLSVRPRM